MKHQYFGDTRDLFKYDLIEALVQMHPDLRGVQCIPMLTPDDGSGQGMRRGYARAGAGYLNHDLVDFLRRSIAEQERNCFNIRNYFSGKPFRFGMIDSSFTHAGRSEYFSRINRIIRSLDHTLILIDPDTGLEIAQPTDKHILYSEIAGMLEVIRKHSMIMIYQHFPRTQRIPYILAREAGLLGSTGLRPSWITDGQIIFFFLCPGHTIQASLDRCLAEYSMQYPSLRHSRNRIATSDIHVEDRPDQEADQE